MTIKNIPPLGRTIRSRTQDEKDDSTLLHRTSLIRGSPTGTPPRDESSITKWRSDARSSIGLPSTAAPSPGTISSSPIIFTNPSRLLATVPYAQSSLARRWQHLFPQPLPKHTIKWNAMKLPACLPLTVEHFPTATELETSYDVFSYDFVVDPGEMRSFLVNPPPTSASVHVNAGFVSTDEARRAWALAVMRGMVAQRLAQGFQFVLCPATITITSHTPEPSAHTMSMAAFRRSKSFMTEDDMTPNLAGASEALKSPDDPVYLSISNEIHRIAYGGDAVQVRRYVRRVPTTRTMPTTLLPSSLSFSSSQHQQQQQQQPFEYQCLIWPRLGKGYTEQIRTMFVSQGLENYGWNR